MKRIFIEKGGHEKTEWEKQKEVGNEVKGLKTTGANGPWEVV
jgi:hypothetical protein